VRVTPSVLVEDEDSALVSVLPSTLAGSAGRAAAPAPGVGGGVAIDPAGTPPGPGT
jgi:hypothetical protein